MTDPEVRERVTQVEARLSQIESLPDTSARTVATEALGGLLDLYGEGLARVVEHVALAGGGEILDALAADELVSHLLLVHGLHPVDPETRVRRALQEVRPYLKSHGGDVELLGIEEGVARLRLEGSCRGCPSSAATLKLTIEEAIWEAAPDLAGVIAEGIDNALNPPGFVPLVAVR